MIPNFNISKSLQSFSQKIKESSLFIEKLWGSPKALLLSLALKATGKNLLVLSGGAREDRLIDNLSFFLENHSFELPAWETLPGEEIPPSPDIMGKRFDVLYHLAKIKEPKIVIAPLQSVLQKVATKEELTSLCYTWKKKDTIPFDEVPLLLTQLGYKRSPLVSDKGQFAVRGGIIDIYPVSAADAYRVEFFGDEIDNIRTFDPIGQKSIAKVDQFFFTPADEPLILSQSKLSSVLDYLGENTLIVFDGIIHLEDAYVKLKEMPGMRSRLMLSIDEMLEAFKNYQCLFFSEELLETLSEEGATGKEAITFEIFNKSYHSERFFHKFHTVESFYLHDESEGDLLDNLNNPLIPKTKAYFLADNEGGEAHLREKLRSKNISHPEILRGFLHSGFVVSDIPLAIIPDAEIFHKKRLRRPKWRNTYHTPTSDFHELKPGDLVVHFHSGIGKYLGTEKQVNHVGKEIEFLSIEYSEGSKLYVPLSQSHLVSRYIGSHEVAPKLSELGSKRWQTTKAKAQQQIMGYASELLQLYASRQVEEGMAFPEDSLEMQEFEESFPYDETPDQLNSLDDIKRDLTSKKPMDRLLCGDVGYGKTEVAMRAAFKTVVDGKKQVAVLVPTTVLALQHFDSFKERMSAFPIAIEALLRFRSPQEINASLKKIQAGKIDIVIGTHRILSKDVQFKDLGLVIIDEEQRFGVKAKEHLKIIKKNAHCLILSATPIPRTLYMSLVKAKDMSVIATPPQDRLPVKNIIAENEDPLIQNAILRELAREGQVFFIHNRVESIYNRANHIQKLVPSAKIAIVHGQMDAEEVDTIFHAFKSGEKDILFSTTIVENGVDVPNANTIIIDRADTFGLADLYQLRGRVGRWNRTAYAYFLTPKQRSLPEIARKRLAALLEAGGYGGGMKIAMRDLEIRGAGDILGIEQSGQVSAIGFHLYCKLLKRTIDALKKKIPASFIETKVEFPYDARLPITYIPESSLRMEIYHRLGESTTFKEIDEILAELKDRFGKPPEEVIWLYHFSRIRCFGSASQFTLLKIERNSLIAEQKMGDKEIKEIIPLPKGITDPPKLEAAIFTLLKSKFHCRNL